MKKMVLTFGVVCGLLVVAEMAQAQYRPGGMMRPSFNGMGRPQFPPPLGGMTGFPPVGGLTQPTFPPLGGMSGPGFPPVGGLTQPGFPPQMGGMTGPGFPPQGGLTPSFPPQGGFNLNIGSPNGGAFQLTIPIR